jgi:hypothetical protein
MRPLGSRPALALAVVLACATRGPTAEPAEEPQTGDIRTSASPPLRVAERRLVLLAPERIEGRLRAVQLEVRLRNDGPAPVTVAADPWLAELSASGAEGPVRCAPASPRMIPPPVVSLEPGASLPLRVDLAARCGFTVPGDYEVEVSVAAGEDPPARARVRVSIAARTWTNPGPR